ncbi:RHS repeat domain-containing protein [Pseudomonas sp. ABY48]|uniref:RHS repeat domain-containing protein n=1 Tax=Pseudomonas sp. ABY48 TaxID=3402865 RepID=UPI003B437CE2
MDALRTLIKRLGVGLLALMLNSAAIADTVTYFHNDISGSPMAATDAAGNLLWKENYKPYGEKLNRSAPSSNNKIGYHGRAYDDATGLSYMGARYYDPVLGRFMGVDPVDFQEDNLHSFNRYAYANNNPYKFVDPTGEYADLAIETMSLAAGMFSFQQNIQKGNYSAAAVDGVGIAADGILAMVPLVPGAAGLAIQGARGLEKTAETSLQVERSAAAAPDFVVSPNGTTFPVPKGASGPSPVINPAGKTTGSAFTNGKGGDNRQGSTMRLMQPTPPKGNSPGYSNGYIKYENKSGQGVDPYSGKTLPQSKSHFEIK